MPEDRSKLVYSTGQDVSGKEKGSEEKSSGDIRHPHQRVTVRLDRKGRSGKSVTVIEGLLLPQKGKEALLKELKSKLGTGGSVKDEFLEIQGDHRDNLISILERKGFRPKRSGG